MALTKIALYNEDKEICIDPIKKISDDSRLTEIARHHNNNEVCYEAFKKISDEDNLQTIALYGDNEEMRFEAIKKISDNLKLIQIVNLSRINDTDIQKAAIDRISDKDYLQRSIKHSFIHQEVRQYAYKRISEMENSVTSTNEKNMSKWQIGTNDEVYTLVGCGHFVVDKNIGDKVYIGVDNYSIDDDGKIRGTACAFNEDGEPIGLFPQSQERFADCEAMGGKYKSGDYIKEKYSSNTLISNGYVIIDISEDGRFIKLGFKEELVEEIKMSDLIDSPFVDDEVVLRMVNGKEVSINETTTPKPHVEKPTPKAEEVKLGLNVSNMSLNDEQQNC